MRILLVQMVGPDRDQDAIIPAGLGYIAAYLRREMNDVEIRIAQHNLRKTVEAFRPDIVGISTVSQTYGEARQFSAWVKAYDERIAVVIGGHHVSALPSTLSEDMDLAIIGEGEATMVEVCRVIQKSGLDYRLLRQVDGIAYLKPSGELCRTEPRQPVQNLDTLPFPARDLMNIRRGDAVGIISSRGCPYNCVFCASKSFWGAPRFHSAEYVVDEVDSVVEQFGPQHIYFWDDLFVANRKRLKRIVSLLKQKGIPDRVRFSLSCRANLVDMELVGLLQDMNVFEVSMGLESFSPETLAFLKDHVTVEDNWKAIDLLNHAGIRILGFFIIGSPCETREEILKTLDAFEHSDLYRAQAYMLTPLPGTEIWDYAVGRGLVKEDVEWSNLYIDDPEDEQNGVVLSEVLPPEEVRKLLSRFQSIRRKRERKVSAQKTLYYLRMIFVDPRTVWSLGKKALGLCGQRVWHFIRQARSRG